MSLGDVDGDGDLDAFVANNGEGNRVWLNQEWDFGDAPTPLPTLFADNGGRHVVVGDGPELRTVALALVDVEPDGQPSADADGDDTSGATPDDEDGVFVVGGQSLGSHRSWSVSLGDVDGDGDLDAFVANGGDSYEGNRVWLNDGSGNFSDSNSKVWLFGEICGLVAV